MKKLAVFVLLLFVVVSSVSAYGGSKRESKRVKALIEQVTMRLDSIVQNQPYEVIHGDKYYRFKEGAFTILSDTVMIGAFGVLDRIRFTAKNGEITFRGIDENGEVFTKTLEQLLFALQKYQ